MVTRLDTVLDQRLKPYIVVIRGEDIEPSRQNTQYLVSNRIADRNQIDFQFWQHIAQFLAPSHLLIK